MADFDLSKVMWHNKFRENPVIDWLFLSVMNYTYFLSFQKVASDAEKLRELFLSKHSGIVYFLVDHGHMIDQQNRALEATPVTLCYCTALCLPMGKTREIFILFSQNQDSSRQIL